jgi:hypothetical protein
VKASDLPTTMPRKGAKATKELAEDLKPCFAKNAASDEQVAAAAAAARGEDARGEGLSPVGAAG